MLCADFLNISLTLHTSRPLFKGINEAKRIPVGKQILKTVNALSVLSTPYKRLQLIKISKRCQNIVLVGFEMVRSLKWLNIWTNLDKPIVRNDAHFKFRMKATNA